MGFGISNGFRVGFLLFRILILIRVRLNVLLSILGLSILVLSMPLLPILVLSILGLSILGLSILVLSIFDLSILVLISLFGVTVTLSLIQAPSSIFFMNDLTSSTITRPSFHFENHFSSIHVLVVSVLP